MAALGRKDKQALLEVDAHVKEIRQQFSDQVKCFDNRTEMKTALISDVQEFFKKRAEVEIEYSQKLDKLSERYQHRLGSQRGTYGLTRIERASTVNVWNKLIQDTRYKAKTASSLSDIFVKNVAVRLGDLIEDIQRISKSVRDTHLTLQEEVMKMIYKLQQLEKYENQALPNSHTA